MCSVPSILRNSRYRRDQRQMEEEEEMWFNEDDDFDENETIVPAAATDILTKKIDSDLDGIGKIMDVKKVEVNGPKMNNNSTQKMTTLNNNATGGGNTSPTNSNLSVENRSALFKRVRVKCLFLKLF